MALAPVGDPFQVNAAINDTESNPAIAIDANGDFAISWTGFPYSGTPNVYAQRYDRNGIPQGDKFQVSSSTSSPVFAPVELVTDANGDFIVTWENITQDRDGKYVHKAFARLYDRDGIPQSEEFQVNTSQFTTPYNLNSPYLRPAIATESDGDFIITWQGSSDNSDPGIYIQRYDKNGNPQGNELRVSASGDTPQVAIYANGDFVIVWSATKAGGDGQDIYARRYNSDGTTQGNEFKVNTFSQYAQSNPAIAIENDGNFTIAWTSGQIGSGDGIYAQAYNSDGTPQGSEFRVSASTNSDPSAAVDANGNYAITWASDDVRARLYSSDGVLQGEEFVQNSYGTQVNPAISGAGNGNFVIAWDGDIEKDYTSGVIYADEDFRDIFVQRFTIAEDGLNLTGTDASELLEGSELADTIAGAGGNDTIRGRDGYDELSGDSGSDAIAGDTGNDTVRGGTDNDTVEGGSGVDIVFGGQGNDLLRGNEGADSVFGSSGKDTIDSGDGSDVLGGGLDNDWLDGNTGNDTMFGGRGNDTLIGGDGVDYLVGISPLSSNQGQGEIDTLTGGAGQDIFVMGARSRNYYDDGNEDNPGLEDYALIADFNPDNAVGDFLLLRSGSGIRYIVSDVPTSLRLNGAALFLDTDNSGNFSANDELIAVVLNVSQTDLQNSNKAYHEVYEG
jgi:Ca2+-binding RTX toxin-like protein